MTRLQQHSVKGLSLIELMIVMGIVGLMAVITIPKMMMVDSNMAQNRPSQITQFLTQIANAVDLQKDETGKQMDTTNPDLEKLIYNYTNYLGLKDNVQSGPVFYPYFLYADGSRLIVNPTVFGSSVYNSPISLPGAGGKYCGDYPDVTNTTSNPPNITGNETSSSLESTQQNQCIYYDPNGAAGPNTIGKTGEIIPIHIDPQTGNVRTLYKAELEDYYSTATLPNSTLCKYVSSYDVAGGIPGASSCP